MVNDNNCTQYTGLFIVYVTIFTFFYVFFFSLCCTKLGKSYQFYISQSQNTS